MWKGIALQILAIVFALAAVVVSFKLLTKHLTGQSGSTWFDAGCPLEAASGGANCGAVLTSRYGYWPPKDAEGNAVPGKRHFPVAYLGLIYYSALAVWLIGVGRPSRNRRWVHLIPIVFMLLGLTGSVYFLVLMFTKLEHWCPWCLVTHVLNLLIAVCLLLLWPRAARPAGAAASAAEARSVPVASQVRAAAHPSWRTVVFALLMILVVWFGEQQLLGLTEVYIEQATTRAEANQYKDMILRIKSDPKKLLLLWDAETQREIALRPDDPVRTQVHVEDGRYIDVVVFSDLECPSCRSAALFLEKQVQPLFGGRMKIAFKHFPLNSSCNPNVAGVTHRNACTAARIAEAARMQGGPAAFWKTHDLLFTRQKPLPKGLDGIDPREVAQAVGVDPERLVADMAHSAVEQRLKEDFDLAVKCGIKSTPLIFAYGKLVDSMTYKDIGFWNALADAYWQSLGIPRPDSTRLPPSSAVTPGTPGPKGAP